MMNLLQLKKFIENINLSDEELAEIPVKVSEPNDCYDAVSFTLKIDKEGNFTFEVSHE